MNIQLLDGATATNGVPTAGDKTAGFLLGGLGTAGGGKGLNVPGDGQCAFILKSTAGSDTMTATVKLWVWSDAISEWAPYGTDSTAASKGILNEGNAIAEFSDVADRLLHVELVNGLVNFEAIYAQLTAIGGTDTAVDAYLVGR